VNAGVTLVKFFPAVAVALGRIPALSALSEPFGTLRFMPAGSILPGDAPSWLGEPAVPAAGGSWPAPRDSDASGRFD